ncbi:microtubule-associated protein futsch-like [Anopheles ziemanni]|uniref:microtubule-associated protein futsch-like n=1 Tax=Anopheles coustani TaxID=139045 RepID=UPI00265A03F3|nr:microtubule-associated protein futsch-like [Anopheles coustani]XP_058168747.1 microtubule-associated protein futsch-like [Anopheles ziemanni]
MSLQALNGQPVQRRSSLLQRYQPKAGSQDPLHRSTVDDTSSPTIAKSTSQRSLQSSSLLQRYQPKPLGSQAGQSGNRSEAASFYDAPKTTSSQRSLDQSKLMRRYFNQPNSVEDAPTGEPANDLRQQEQQHQQQRYSSQKSLENSKLMQRYNPINNSQEFTGLSGRESTPVARFNRGGSLEPERVQRSSLLSKYTPRFGKSLDRHQALEMAGHGMAGYSSQQNLRTPTHRGPPETSQSLATSRSEIADYGADHYDQYQNIRSRSSSLSRGGVGSARKGMQRGSQRHLPLEPEPSEPVTPETLPVVTATAEPVMGNIASALPMPMLSVIPPTPAALEVVKPSFAAPQSAAPVQQVPPAATKPVTPSPSMTTTVGVTPTPPAKPARKDLPPKAAPAPTANIVSIAIPSITATLAAPSVKQSVSSEPPSAPKEPSPPLFSTRDRMDHYGSASNPEPSHEAPTHQRPTKALARTPTTTLQLPLSDMSSRRSMTDLQRLDYGDTAAPGTTTDFADVSEFADRAELQRIAAQKPHPVKHTLASAFEQLAAFTIPNAIEPLDDEERIEAMPPNRKLKRRDYTYHPSFVPKQPVVPSEQTLSTPGGPTVDSRVSTGSSAAEEKRQKAAEEKRRREEERHQKEEEKRRKDADKRAHDEEDKRRKDQEKHARDEEERRRREDDRKHKDEEKRAREEEKRRLEEEKRREKEEKKRVKEEKKKAVAALKASITGAKTDAPPMEESKAPEEEMIDLASHLDHYSVATTKQTQQQQQQQRGHSLGRPRSGGTPYGSQGALGSSTLGGRASLSNSHQSLDRNGSTASVRQSKLLLQRYGPKSGSQEVISSGTGSAAPKEFHRSQGSLDYRRPMRPGSLLDKYTPRPLSASTATGGQPQAGSSAVGSTSQRSLESSSLLQRYKPKGSVPARTAVPGYDQYDHRDHEYEPIGEPTVDASKVTPAKDALLTASKDKDGQERKLSSASFLRVPGDEGDTISMEELQKSIEDRYFNLPTDTEAPAGETTDAAAAAEPGQGEKTNKVKAAMARAQSSGKQAMAKAQESGKQAMAKAQESGKTLQKKLMLQTDRLKTKMSNIKLKKDKDQPAPLASPEVVTTPELEKLDFTLAVPKDEQEQEQQAELQESAIVAEGQETAVQEAATTTEEEPAKGGRKLGDKLKNIHMPKIQKPDFKRPEFTKISKPKMPKLKAPDMPKFLTEKPDFSKMKSDFAKMKLTRSKSMKEASPSAATSAASPSDVSVVGDAPASAPTKLNYTDFSTYPRLFDKFKRQKSTPTSGQASVRAGTPPPLEFTKTTKTTRTKGPSFISRWASDKSEDTESNRFLQYTGSELDDRETSVERRMRQELERAEFEGPELAITEEQKQLEEYDKENREIHLASAARHEEFLKRKPPMERQESDLASEEEKQFWASSLGQKIRQNIDMNSNDLDFLDEEERLLVAKENLTIDEEAHEQARMLLKLSKERSEKEFERRSSTPYTDKECQSSGSSSARRRKGVLEEIDDDEFFLRQKGISKDDIQMGEYISSAIKEGLSHPKNALADMGRYDYYDEDQDRDGLRRYYQPSFESDDISNRQVDSTDFYRTFPPDRPSRKGKKSTRDEDDRAVPEDQDYEPEDEEDDLAYYDRQRTAKYGSEQPQLLQSATARYMDDEDLEDEASSLRREAMLAGSVVPPTPPTRRRKKRFRDVTPSDVNGTAPFDTNTGKSISNTFIAGPHVTSMTVNRAEVPLAKEESFGTLPAPTPRRSRSRSQISKALDDDDRVSRGAESLIVGIIDRAPTQRESYRYEVSESNGYATVRKEAPPRPPAPTIRRRKSTRSLDAQPQPTRAFNTLPNYHHSVSPVRPQRNYSTINPNRPPRRKSVTSLTGEQQQKPSRLSRDDVRGRDYEDVAPPVGPKPPTVHSGDVANKMKDRPLPPPPRPTRKPRRPDGSDHQDLDGGAERLVPMGVEEVEIAIQTDPVSEDLRLDAEIAAVTARADRAQDGDILEGALSRFRDGNAKALSDRPKSSRSGSRPETPASILIERKVSTPSLTHESVVEASLTVQPLEEFDDDQYIAELVKKYVSEERKPEPTHKSDTFERRFRKSTNSLTREDEIRPQEVGTALRAPTFRSSRTSVDGRLSATTPEPLRNVEIAPNVIEEIVERLRTTEQHHIDELQKLHQEQLEGLRRQHEEQKRLQEQKLEEQQRQLLQQQNQQLLETQQLKEQILQQQEHQKMLLAQQQNQQQQLLVAQQQQQLLMEQQEKERELQREKERELLKEREQELERARERERELHLSRELELQRAREVEQQRARDLEQQRIREMELQRAREMEHQRLRELEIQRAIEAEQARQREMELQQKAAVAAAAAAAAATATATNASVTPSVAVVSTETHVAAGEEPTSQEEKPVEATEGAVASMDVVDGTCIAPPSVTVAPLASEQPPVRPPLPSMAPPPPFVYHPDYLSYGLPSTSAAGSAYLTRPNPSDDDPSMTPLAPQRRRRHHRSKRESTSEEDFQRDQHRRHRHGTRSPEPSIPSLGGQLMRACGSSLAQTGEDLMAMLRASSKDENKRDLHIAILILIVIVAGLMALGMSGEKAVHHHHWDYFSPPGHGSSA